MNEISIIGLDLAKSIFQVHRIDASGMFVVRRQLQRRQVPAFFRKLPDTQQLINTSVTVHFASKVINYFDKLLGTS